MRFQSPQWGDNSKVIEEICNGKDHMFQSPQWGDNSKAGALFETFFKNKFQSPQWGDNSKADVGVTHPDLVSFSPRNGEIILKLLPIDEMKTIIVSVPAMGR